MRYLPVLVVGAALACASSSTQQAPAAPANLAAIFDVNRAEMKVTWDPVANATGYRVYLNAPGFRESSFDNTSTTFATGGVLYPVGMTVTVTALHGALESARPAPLEYVKPAFGIQPGTGVVHLSWNGVEFPRVEISRFVSGLPGPVTAVVDGGAGAWDDTGLVAGTSYQYRLHAYNGPVQEIADTASATTTPAIPTGFNVSYVGEQIFVAWPPVQAGADYPVRWSLAQGGEYQPGPVPNWTCGTAPVCWFEISAVGANGLTSDWSAPFPVTAVPGVPAAPVLTGGTNLVQVALPTPGTNVDHFSIERAQAAPAITLFAPVATAPGGTFIDTPAPWASYRYRIRAVTPDGVQSLPSTDNLVAVYGAPDSMNLSGASQGSGISEGQRITVQHGGFLMAVEVGAISAASGLGAGVHSRGRAIASGGGATAVPWAGALSADLQGGTVIPFIVTGAVSAGEIVDLTVGGTTFALSDVVGTGGHLIHASLDAAHDLVYKLYIQPDATLTSPGVIDAKPGVGGVLVSWSTPSPGATRYDVYGADDGGAPALLGSTHQRWFEDRALAPGVQRLYSVTAVGDTQQLSSTASAAVHVDGTVLDAANLGDAPAAAAVKLCALGGAQAPTHIGQTFVVERTGTIATIDLRLEDVQAPRIATLQILDAHGALLGSASKQMSGFGQVAPLDPIVRSDLPFDFSGTAIPVVAGDSLALRLSFDDITLVQCVLVRDTADAYAGGAETVDDVVVPGRDLAFRVTVR